MHPSESKWRQDFALEFSFRRSASVTAPLDALEPLPRAAGRLDFSPMRILGCVAPKLFRHAPAHRTPAWRDDASGLIRPYMHGNE